MQWPAQRRRPHLLPEAGELLLSEDEKAATASVWRWRRRVWLALTCGMLFALTTQSSEALAVSWGTGVKAALPADAGSKPNVALSSVSCASAGDCSAVGSYTDSSDHRQGLLLSKSGGTWARGVKATLPAGAGSKPSVRLNAVSCPSAGNCSAVGSYTDGSGKQGLLLSESGGTWAAGTKAVVPADAFSRPRVVLSSVS